MEIAELVPRKRGISLLAMTRKSVTNHMNEYIVLTLAAVIVSISIHMDVYMYNQQEYVT